SRQSSNCSKRILISSAKRRAIRISLCIACCWVLSGEIAEAQQSSAATPKPSPANTVPTPIPLSEIASEGESTAESIRTIETSSSTDKITATVEGRLPQVTKEIELRTTEMAKLLAASVPLEFLHYMEVALQTF